MQGSVHSMDRTELTRRYEEDGYLVFPSVLDADLLHAAGEHVEWLQRKNPDLRPEALHHHLMWDDPFWLRLVSDSRLLDLAELIVGPDIALFASHYICKPGGDGLPVLWHQDGSYWPLEPMEVVTAWLAVDDSTVENGCMRVIPGSHRGPMLAHRKHDTEAVLHTAISPSEIDESRTVDVEIPAGGVSLHHPMLIHGSNPNLSPMRRCGLTIRYIPTTTRITRSDWTTFLLRGRPVTGINEYSPLPRFRPEDHFAGDLPQKEAAHAP
jgi:ectoine hydroxylase-related dioxygenase (phytanoyl-CoA dioxygenase family)